MRRQSYEKASDNFPRNCFYIIFKSNSYRRNKIAIEYTSIGKGRRNMFCETKYLRENNENVYLKAFISDSIVPQGARPAVLVIPGGGYSHCSAREAEPVAKKFIAEGFNAFVLNYTLLPDVFGKDGEFIPLTDTSLALAYIRENSERYFVNPEKIAVIGFSAGGHLAALIGARWHEEKLALASGKKNEDIKPNAVLMSYALSVTREQPGIENLMKNSFENADELLDYLSADLAVTEHMPPTFMWHTAPDNVVPVKETLIMAEALSAAKIPFETHIFPVGGHGLSVCDADVGEINFDTRYCSAWVKYALDWVKMTFSL